MSQRYILLHPKAKNVVLSETQYKQYRWVDLTDATSTSLIFESKYDAEALSTVLEMKNISSKVISLDEANWGRFMRNAALAGGLAMGALGAGQASAANQEAGYKDAGSSSHSGKPVIAQQVRQRAHQSMDQAPTFAPEGTKTKVVGASGVPNGSYLKKDGKWVSMETGNQLSPQQALSLEQFRTTMKAKQDQNPEQWKAKTGKYPWEDSSHPEYNAFQKWKSAQGF